MAPLSLDEKWHGWFETGFHLLPLRTEDYKRYGFILISRQYVLLKISSNKHTGMLKKHLIPFMVLKNICQKFVQFLHDSLPLASTGWVESTIRLFCTIYSCTFSISSAVNKLSNIRISFYLKKIRGLDSNPVQLRMLPLYYAPQHFFLSEIQ